MLEHVNFLKIFLVRYAKKSRDSYVQPDRPLVNSTVNSSISPAVSNKVDGDHLDAVNLFSFSNEGRLKF